LYISIKFSIKRKRTTLKDKVFRVRESLLTQLFEIDHIRTVKHIFTAVLIIICVQMLILDYISHDEINIDFKLLKWLFSGLERTMIFTWLPMQFSSLVVVYFLFNFWTKHRETGNLKLIKQKKTIKHLKLFSNHFN
jgi:sterol O-acyltransferase